jgi:mRNA-degrading endonuclease toxin of MazEF toxin-antitoxin module
VVVLVPVAALVLVAQAWSAPIRRWAGIGGPLLCAGALVMVPVTTHAGYWLRDHLPPQLRDQPAIRRHVALGRGLLPWVAAMLVLSVAVWALGRRPAEARRPIVMQPTAGTAPLQLVVAVVATVVAVGAIVQTVRIGDSGAQAVWRGTVVTTK